MQPQSKKAFNRKQRRDPLLHPPPHFETVSQYRKGCMCRPRVISNAVRNLRSLTFVRDDNLMFSTLRHSLFLRGRKEVGAHASQEICATGKSKSIVNKRREVWTIRIPNFYFLIFPTFMAKSAFPAWLRLCRALLIVGGILLVLPVGRVFAQESRESGQPPEVQVVRTKEVTMITIAGVGPRDKDGKLVAPGDFAAQFKQTWENLRRLIVSAGSPLRSIVSITVYTPDAKWQDAFKELQQESFSDWNPPASFAVTQQLRTPGALLEIHAVAVIENRKPIRR